MAVQALWSSLLLLSLALLLCPGVESDDNTVFLCRRNCSYPEVNVNLNLIQGVWDTLEFDHHDLYQISLCGSYINSVGCVNASVCINVSISGQTYTLGTQDTCRVEFNPTSKSLLFSFKYENVRPFRNSYVNVSLICGSRAGVPIVVNKAPIFEEDEGGALIEWVTRAACSTASPYRDSASAENKCYTVQNTWSATSGIPADIYDLSPLITNKLNGYQVDTPDYPEIDMRINPCHPINSHYSSCNSSVACKLESGVYKAVSSFSSDARVEIKNNQLQLHYPLNPTRNATLNCTGPSGLTINFNCPVGDLSTVPTLVYVSGDHCYHEVVWNTDHACGRSRISNESCDLTFADGTSFNLTSDPKIMAEQPVNGTEVGVTYYLRICSEDYVNSDECLNKQARVAQVTSKHTNDPKCYVIGGDRQTLSYADGVLSLLVEGGDPCSDHFRRSTLITFVCDKDAEGTSTDMISYQGETNHCFYSFEWVTPAACRPERTASDCRLSTNVKGEIYEYDFAQLAVGEENHIVSGSEDNVACIQVNLCGKLVVGEHDTSEEYCNHKHVPVSCTNASVCVLLNNNTAFPWGTFDAGNASQVVHASHLILTLKTVDGPPCMGKRRCVTVIDFVCRPGTLGFHPHYVGMDNDCTYKLEWQTAYACPLSTVVGGSDCQVEDPKTGSLFNLKGLKRDRYYSFNTSEYEYQINFCGSAVGTECRGDHVGMCQVNLKTRTTHSVAGKSNTTLEYDGGVLRAIYSGGDKCTQNNQPRSTTIIFECNPEANKPTIVSVKEFSHCQYVVTVQTAEACPIEFRGMDCTYTSDSQNEYDLTSLIKHSDQNWEASTPTEVFVINVCRPLNAPSGGCTSASSVCSYSVGKGRELTFEKSLGRPSTGKLSMNKDKHLMLSYTCTDTTSTGSCGTNISFICDKTVAVTNGPTFEFMLDGLYHFTWRTPYACPVNKDKEQSSCAITDPLTNDMINFTTLHREQDLEIPYTNKGKFIVNVCGPLVSSVDGCGKDAVVCQLTPEGTNHSTGSLSSVTLSRHQDGTAELVYEGGDSCNSGPKRKTVFLFVCPEQTTTDPPPPYYVNETECTYNFVWPTRLACLPKRMECTAEEDQYDLRTLAESNTEVDLHHVQSNSSLVISLCGPVNLTSDSSLSRCPFGTAACWYNNSAAISLGEVDRGFVPFSDVIDGLELRYIGGNPCHTGGPPSQLLITLVCSEGAEGIPELSPPDWTSCNFNVRWTTRFACPHRTVTKNCSVQDPYTGQSFNFADVLKGATELSAPGQDNKYNYTVSICGEGVHCGNGSQADVAGCQRQPTNPGFAMITGLLSNVTVRNQGWGEWLLSFGGGDPCRHNSKMRKTIIHVECNSSMSAGSPNLLSLGEDECEYYFRLLIYNKSLCHEVHPRQSCVQENYDMLALSARGNMEAAGLWNGGKLFLSICQPLNLSSPGVSGCKAGAGACVIGEREGITSYFPDGSPKVLSGGRGLMFNYKGDKNAVIVLEVRCDRSTEYSTPIISHIDHQSYNIYLRTIYGCSSDLLKLSVGPSDNVCSISNPYNSQTYDLSKVFSSTSFSVNGTDGSTLHFDLCGATNKCGGGNVAVCSEQKSGVKSPIAGRNHTIAIAGDEALEVDFVDRRACIGVSGRTYSSVRVTLVCSPHGDSSPVLQSVAKRECAVDIFMPTPVLCSQTSPCEVTASNGGYYDLTALMSTIWEGPVQDSTDHFVIGVCRALGPTNAAKHNCQSTTGICLNGKNLGHMTGSPHIVSDNHVTLEYTGGDVCSLTANYSTTVILICSDSGLLNKPMLTRSPSNNCSYEVTFVTPDACMINQEKQNMSVTKNNCTFTGAEGIKLDFNQLPDSVEFLGYPSLSPNFTIARCDRATVNSSSGSTVLHFNAANSTAQRNTAVMVFDIKEKERDTTPCSDTVNVQMICNQSDTSDDGNHYYDGVSACVYSLRWYTRFACTASQVACHFHNGSSSFELSPLRSEQSHTVRDATGDTYYINICSPLRGSGVPSECAQDSAVCVKRSDDAVQDLASITTQKLLLSADKKYVMFQFTLRGGGGSILIQMECAAVFQNPTFTEKRSTSYWFSWRTPYGCGEKPKGPVTCSCDTQECPNPPPSSSVELSYTSFNIAQIKLRSFTFSAPNKQYFFSICEACDAKACKDRDRSPAKGTTKLAVNAVQFVVEDNYLSIEGSNDKSLKVTVSLSCLNVSTTTTELLFVSETNNHFLLTGSTSFCKRSVVLPTSEGPGTHSTPPPLATSSQASIAVVAIAVSIIVAVVIGGCLFVLCKNKKRRFVMKGVFFRLFAVKDNGPVKYRALSQEDTEETAVLLAMDRQGDGDSDTDSEKSDSEPKGGKKAVNPKLDDPGHELVTDDEMLEL